MVAGFRYKKLVFSILLAVSLLLATGSRSGAFDLLINPRDIISTASLQAMAYHEIRFSLSTGSNPIETDDYIFFDFPHFTGITEPTSISGYYTGTPVYAVIGTRIRITGIHLNPGVTITFKNITAYNPEDPDEFDIYISIAEDPDGLAYRAFAHILATPTDGTITMTASILARVGTLRISGTAPPGMFINFIEGGNIIGTAIATNDGNFTQIFPNMAPMSHSIIIIGTDSESRNTAPTFVEIFPRPFEVTSVSGLLLPPTISLDKETIKRGESLTITGSGVPYYTLKVFSEPPVSSYELEVPQGGSYSYTFSDTQDLDYGDHRIYALLQDSLGTHSLFSPTVFFKVVDTDESSEGEEPDHDISQGDLNGDSSVNLVDFSILLYYWGSNSALADVNNDGKVDLVDFSIMMFYWG